MMHYIFRYSVHHCQTSECSRLIIYRFLPHNLPFYSSLPASLARFFSPTVLLLPLHLNITIFYCSPYSFFLRCYFLLIAIHFLISAQTLPQQYSLCSSISNMQKLCRQFLLHNINVINILYILNIFYIFYYFFYHILRLQLELFSN